MAYLLAIIAGVLNMLQSGSNSTLNEKLGVGPVIPALIVYAGGMLGVLLAAPVIGKPVGAFASNVGQVPWWGWIGGLMASVYVVATLTVSKGMGAGAFTAVTLTAAVITSLALDHFGLLGFDVHRLSALRVVGGVLMIAGVGLIAKF